MARRYRRDCGDVWRWAGLLGGGHMSWLGINRIGLINSRLGIQFKNTLGVEGMLMGIAIAAYGVIILQTGNNVPAHLDICIRILLRDRRAYRWIMASLN